MLTLIYLVAWKEIFQKFIELNVKMIKRSCVWHFEERNVGRIKAEETWNYSAHIILAGNIGM